MKTTHSLLAALLLLFALPAFSQEDIRSEILNLPESEFNFVNKARRLLGTYIKEGNMVEAIKIKDALLDEFNGKVTEAFYNWEYIHLLYATEEYETLLKFTENIDFNQIISSNVSTSAQTDNLGKLLFENTMAFNDIMEINIKESVENKMSQTFLLLLLKDIAHTSPQYSKEREEHTELINKLANEYLSNYPDSPHDKLVREQIRFEFAESDWGLYLDFGLGSSLNNDGLKENIGRGGISGTIGFEYRHKKVLARLYVDIADSKLAKDIDINNTTWREGSVSTNASFGLNAGYLLFENKRWSIYPLAGAGYSNIYADNEQTKENPNLKKLKLNTFYPEIGFGIDFKYYLSDPISGRKSPFGRFSLNYKYKMYNFERKNPLLNGHQHFIVLTYGLGGRPLKRVE